MAVEVGMRARLLPALSYTVELEALCCAQRRAALEQIAARIGLSDEATRIILDDADARASRLAAAHALIKALIPHERAVLALIAEVADDVRLD
jgi:hypothetical protein